MDEKATGCDKKAPMKTLLSAPEKRFILWLAPKFPAWTTSRLLTMMTVLWILGVIGFGMLAGHTGNRHWLWLSSVMIFMQWFTDCFDGAIGRARNEGLVKWGFYMDHFLDFVFMCSVFIGWSFLFEGLHNKLLWFMSLGMGCLMVNAFLSFGATNQFKITYLATGPTEMRLYFMLINAAIALFDTGWLEKSIVYIFIAFWLAIIIVVYRTQKHIYTLDMEIKHQQEIGDRS
ncbi:MAG: CDP-alcohol phosphatidyltransferase family protein [Planctomycetota bacterium]|jgi:phosphatidylglycerophosphate synthase